MSAATCRVAFALATACHVDGTSSTVVDPIFEADYASTFTMVRDCRRSADHDLQQIRIFADPSSVATYQNRDAEFPIGTLLVKEQYDFGDLACTGPIVQWTAALKVDDPAAHLGFRWQRVTAARTVASEDDPLCYGCHTNCTDPTMNGYRFTCSQPP